ncbi:ExeM/NucH family extracellular endonuclease [Arenimonas terrae]|uniref:ExeM/NucH family extracellular endonuclease n=1 Tax=Arenimonas terrae TaxID=2546226 RepID=A0A5C4RP24_9GAMM|nr:ExeM/NucH family extracellular endonuclease [Arenimonas terrae]TNJ32669.1 ExeM/NucH family extracellular endonuclease [Arenimonas terrae]
MRLCLLIAASLLATACEAPGATAAPPADGLRPIGAVQGSGPRSPLDGQPVVVEGVVVGAFAGLGGAFLQSETEDGDPATAEGLFLDFGASALARPQVGDRVRVTGIVFEGGQGEGTLTSLQVGAIERLGQGQVIATTLADAPATAADWERYEGMRLSITGPLTISGNDLARFGELTTSFGGRLYTPTELAPPGAGAQAIAEDNTRRMLRLDDGVAEQNPKTVAYLPAAPSDEAPLRTGSTLTGVQGVLDQRFGSYRLQLTEQIGSIEQAPRPAAPSVPGDRRIAGFNVLNLFNGDGQGGGFPTERGAQTPEQYARQQAKLVAVVQALDPDLAALMELENDGYGPESSLAQFVAALNAAGPHADWRYVDAGEGPGTNPIRVGIVYRASRFTAVGAPATLAEGPFADRSRAPLVQAFRAGDGPVFVVAANHFKSKGCGEASGGDADLGDGQACYNATRVDSARRLHDWLATDPTGTGATGALVIGDLNAHAEEDPLRLLRERGWQDAFVLAGADKPYSYVWGGQSARLDHALLDAGLAARLRGAAEWHINSDEAEAFDYRRDAPASPWRASDHDPMLLGLDLARPGL